MLPRLTNMFIGSGDGRQQRKKRTCGCLSCHHCANGRLLVRRTAPDGAAHPDRPYTFGTEHVVRHDFVLMDKTAGLHTPERAEQPVYAVTFRDASLRLPPTAFSRLRSFNPTVRFKCAATCFSRWARSRPCPARLPGTAQRGHSLSGAQQ